MNGPSPRVFIVEDEALIAMQLEDQLQRFGYTVCGVAAYGEAALREIPVSRPDVVLMDIRLGGGMDGIETARQLRGRTDATLIFLSAFSDPDVRSQATECRPFGYLLKPINDVELRSVVQGALDSRDERAKRDAKAPGPSEDPGG